ncbi:MAG TPA: hypothetical protein VIR60_00770 [Gammaproteobacteria bacterium]
MATEEQTEIQINALLSQLNGKEQEYSFLIPGWSPENSAMALRWMRSQLWEGFYVYYQVDHSAKQVRLKTWEFGEQEPSWEAI